MIMRQGIAVDGECGLDMQRFHHHPADDR